MPYSKIQFFTIQTPGFAEIFSDSEMYVVFSDGTTATFEFNGKTDIGQLCLSYGGGGHTNAGTCQLDNDIVDKELPNIIAVLNGEK
jgi:nanoRNase/pAp phosphatase (c-di-AMP/oligoRNAs hydrolase)